MYFHVAGVVVDNDVVIVDICWMEGCSRLINGCRYIYWFRLSLVNLSISVALVIASLVGCSTSVGHDRWLSSTYQIMLTVFFLCLYIVLWIPTSEGTSDFGSHLLIILHYIMNCVCRVSDPDWRKELSCTGTFKAGRTHIRHAIHMILRTLSAALTAYAAVVVRLSVCCYLTASHSSVMA